MQMAAFNARCPFEIGDKVKDGRTGAVHAITDIACIHFVKAGRVEFRYEVNNSGQYIELAVPGPEHTEKA